MDIHTPMVRTTNIRTYKLTNTRLFQTPGLTSRSTSIRKNGILYTIQ